jgi:hypothetical protein
VGHDHAASAHQGGNRCDHFSIDVVKGQGTEGPVLRFELMSHGGVKPAGHHVLVGKDRAFRKPGGSGGVKQERIILFPDLGQPEAGKIWFSGKIRGASLSI